MLKQINYRLEYVNDNGDFLADFLLLSCDFIRCNGSRELDATEYNVENLDELPADLVDQLITGAHTDTIESFLSSVTQ